MAKSNGRRIIMRIELSPTAKRSFTGKTDKLGMTQIATTSRIIEWFVAQDSEAQAAILGVAPSELGVDPAVESLKRVASRG
jgi:hypothetical protein